jgi:hypothetical protein
VRTKDPATLLLAAGAVAASQTIDFGVYPMLRDVWDTHFLAPDIEVVRLRYANKMTIAVTVDGKRVASTMTVRELLGHHAKKDVYAVANRLCADKINLSIQAQFEALQAALDSLPSDESRDTNLQRHHINFCMNLYTTITDAIDSKVITYMIQDIITNMVADLDDVSRHTLASRLVERSFVGQIRFWLILSLLQQFGLFSPDLSVPDIFGPKKKEGAEPTQVNLRDAIANAFEYQKFFDVASALMDRNAELERQ